MEWVKTSREWLLSTLEFPLPWDRSCTAYADRCPNDLVCQNTNGGFHLHCEGGHVRALVEAWERELSWTVLAALTLLLAVFVSCLASPATKPDGRDTADTDEESGDGSDEGLGSDEASD